MESVGLESIYPIFVGAVAIVGVGLGVQILLDQKSRRPPVVGGHSGGVGARVQAMGSTRV